MIDFLLFFVTSLQSRYTQQFFFIEGIRTGGIHLQQFDIGRETFHRISIYVFHFTVFLKIVLLYIVPAGEAADVAFLHVIILSTVFLQYFFDGGGVFVPCHCHSGQYRFPSFGA